MRSFPKTRRSTNNPWLLVIVLILACHPSGYYRNGSSQSVSELLLTVGSLRLLAVTEAFTSDPFRLHSSAVSALTRRARKRRTLDVPPFLLLSSSSSAQQQPQEEEEEWHPHDPAWTTSQLLKGLWSQIAQAKDMVKGVRVCVFVCVCAWFCYIIVQFLNNNNPSKFNRKHIQSCIRKWRNSSIRHAF